MSSTFPTKVLRPRGGLVSSTSPTRVDSPKMRSMKCPRGGLVSSTLWE